ncbi:MAG: aldehyde dehydrogenase family protein [Opitutales bacterium]|nr:aldehyde dehydrogenase family protein [Opitutales bacterium]
MSTAAQRRNRPAGDPRVRLVDPYSGEDRGPAPLDSPAQIEAQLQRAHAAFRMWRAVGAGERACLVSRLRRRLDNVERDLAADVTAEMGKLYREALGEIESVRRLCAWLCGEGPGALAPEKVDAGDRRFEVHYCPLGIVLIVMPWNFPVWQVLRTALPLLLAGNAVVLKHAPNVPECARGVAALMADAGFPPGLFSNVFADNSATIDMVRHPLVAGVSFTGGRTAGALIGGAAGAAVKKSVLELGGNDAWIIMEGCDAGPVVEAVADTRLRNCGQSCLGPKRVLVHRSLYAEVRDGLADRFAHRRPGPPMDPATRLAPMAKHGLRDGLDAKLTECRRKGDRVVTGGAALSGPGAFYAPTVLETRGPGSPVWDEELFGPVAAVASFEGLRDAVDMANATPYGLGAVVFDPDAERAARVLRDGLRVGVGAVNERAGSHPAVPFGGAGASGYGREMGVAGLREFTLVKTIRLR